MAYRYSNVEYTEMVRMLARCDDNVVTKLRAFNQIKTNSEVLTRVSEQLIFRCGLCVGCDGCDGDYFERYVCDTHRHARYFNLRGVCLIEHASGRTTEKVTNHNNSYTSFGLFQINNKEWCKKGRKGGHCSMKCEDLLNEDLADDVRCAKRIYDRVGFKAWPASYAYCKEKSLPDLSRC